MARDDRRPPQWPAVLAGTIFFAASALLLYESVREYFPRNDLRSFDERRGRLLSAENRAAYERELFSELSQWNRLSRRYPTESGTVHRERRWRQLASEGFELAHIALQVLEPDGGYVYPLEKPMRRLQALAEQGDTGAMCLMTALVAQVNKARVSGEHAEIARKWLLQGAERGHAECRLQLGRRLLLGIDGMDRDTDRGLSLEFAARRTGYAHDVDGLVAYFQQRWSTEPADLTRLYCWLSIEGQSRLADGSQKMLRLIRVEAKRHESDRLKALADQLESTHLSLQACVDMGSG